MKIVIRVRTNLRFALVALLTAYCTLFPAYGQKEYSIADIQGDKNISAHEKEKVRVSGIVTATTKTGFFIQTADEKADQNPGTSEGIFVFTKNEPPAEASIGNLVTVTGTVEEFRQRNEPNGLTITEISFFRDRDSITVVSKENTLPKAVVLTAADLKPNKVDQLEKFEGMLVAVGEFIVVAPTGGRVDVKTATAEPDGTFYGVVKGMGRPYREPGMDIMSFLGRSAKEKEKLKADHPKMAIFDGNPERIRVESLARARVRELDIGSDAKARGVIAIGVSGNKPIDVPAYSELKNVVGVLHYARGSYTIYTSPGTMPQVVNTIKPLALPPPTERQFSVAAMNIENFFDDNDDPAIKEDVVSAEGFQRRLKKISLAVRTSLQTPDVIGVVEAENLSTLKRLAEKINFDSEAAGKPNPRYEAYLVEGNDERGIDNGFLVKSSRVKILETKQFGKNDKYKNPDTGADEMLNARPPLMLRASINDPQTGQPFEFTLVVNHLKSLLGYDDPKRMNNVRLQKRLQAEFLARFVQDRLKVNPSERIMLIGDFNAFQFNDGVMDVIGTIKGKPAAKDEVLIASEDLLDPDMIDLVDLIKPDQRYSYVFDGNAQVLDHIIVTESLRGQIRGFGYARVNADYPESYLGDDKRLERFSDHDPAIAYFGFDATAPR